MHASIGRLAGYVIGFGSLFAIWHVASVYLLNSILFPPPGRVIAKAVSSLRTARFGKTPASACNALRWASSLAR